MLMCVVNSVANMCRAGARGFLVRVTIAGLLAGCTAAPVTQGINDPYEVQNRKRFEQTIRFDRAVLRPAANAYGQIAPEPARIIVGNVASNLALPSSVVNDVLQGNIGDAFINTARFAFNSTIGLLGTLDPATLLNLHARETDFGETLHVWGVGEGIYLVLPAVGPTTERDAVGKVVDIFTNPLGYVLPTPERFAVPASGVLAGFGDRYKFRSTIDSVLYESADAYGQSRLLYLEKRRFELGGTAQDDYFDPYDDPYAQ